MKHSFTTYVYHVDYGAGQPSYEYNQSPNMEDYGWVKVGQYDFTVDIPDGFDPTARRVELLERRREREIAELDKRLAQLRAARSPLATVAEAA